MVKEKKHSAWEAQRRESGMGPGESNESNQVVSDIAAAKEIYVNMGQQFDISQVLEKTGYVQLPDIEKAYVQERLKKDLNEDLPENFKPPQEAIAALETERAAVLAGAQRSISDKSEKESEEETETTLAQKIEGIRRLIKNRYEQAKSSQEVFVVEDEIAQYRDQIGEEGIMALRGFLQSDEVRDIVLDIVQELETSPAQRKRFEFVRFEYRNGQLFIVQKYEGEDKELRPKPYKKFDLPKEFEKIMQDQSKHRQALEELVKLYKETNLRKIKVVPQWSNGKIKGFKIEFGEAGRSLDAPQDDDVIERVNRASSEKGKYWQTDGFDFEDWKRRVKNEAVKQYIQIRIREITDNLREGMVAGVAKVAPDIVAPEAAKPPERLTPADVGMNAEQAIQVREIVRQNLIKAWAETLASKYPKMAAKGEEFVRSVAVSIIEDVDLEEVFQRALINYRDRKK